MTLWQFKDHYDPLVVLRVTMTRWQFKGHYDPLVVLRVKFELGSQHIGDTVLTTKSGSKSSGFRLPVVLKSVAWLSLRYDLQVSVSVEKQCNFEVTGITRPRKDPHGASGNRTPDLPLPRRTP